MLLPKRLTRYFLFIVMMLVGLSVLGLLVSSFDVETAKLLRELMAIVVLLVVLMAAAFVTALGIRAIQNRRERSRRQKEDEDEDED